MRTFIAMLLTATTLSGAAFAQAAPPNAPGASTTTQSTASTAPGTATSAQTQTQQPSTEDTIAANRKEYEKTLMEREGARKKTEIVSHGKMLAKLYAKPVNPTGAFKNPKCMPAVVPLKNGRGKSIICTGFIQ